MLRYSLKKIQLLHMWFSMKSFLICGALNKRRAGEKVLAANEAEEMLLKM